VVFIININSFGIHIENEVIATLNLRNYKRRYVTNNSNSVSYHLIVSFVPNGISSNGNSLTVRHRGKHT